LVLPGKESALAQSTTPAARQQVARAAVDMPVVLTQVPAGRTPGELRLGPRAGAAADLDPAARLVLLAPDGSTRVVAAAGPAAEGVLFPLLCEPDAMPASFRLEFENRYQVSPDYAAASTYDALNLLIAAIRRGGLNRAKIGDALGEVSPYPGVTGMIAWDKLGSNTRPVGLGTIRAGQVATAEGTKTRSPLRAR